MAVKPKKPESPTAKPKSPIKLVVNLPLSTADFFCQSDGKWYFVEKEVTDLTIIRYQVLEKRLIELGLSMDFGTLMTNLGKALESCSPDDYREAYTMIYNILSGLRDIETKKTIALWICTLFIYREDEVPSEYNEIIAQQKMKAWTDEGIAIGFFLNLAIGLLIGFKRSYEQILAEFSDIVENPTMAKERQEAIENLFQINTSELS